MPNKRNIPGSQSPSFEKVVAELLDEIRELRNSNQVLLEEVKRMNRIFAYTNKKVSKAEELDKIRANARLLLLQREKDTRAKQAAAANKKL